MFEEKPIVQIQAKAKIPIAPAYLGAAGIHFGRNGLNGYV
jgi:hypothetical protein